MMLQDIGMALKDSVIEISARFVDSAPAVILAILILVIGWFLASWIGKAFSMGINSLKLDGLLAQTGLKELSHKAGFNLSVGNFFGFIIKWGLVLAVVKVAFSTLNFGGLNDAIDSLIAYIPQVIVAGAILIGAALLAQFLDRIVTASAKAADVKQAAALGFAARSFVWIVGIATALEQLQVASGLVRLFDTLLVGIIAAIAIAAGIAFGLGGKEAAGRLVNKLESEIK